MNKRKPQLPARMRRYLDDQRISCKPPTIGTYTGALRDFHAFLRKMFRSNVIKPKHIAMIDRKTLHLYLSHLHAQQLAPYSTVNKFLAIRKYLAWEADRRMINRSALEGFDRSSLPKVPDYLPRPLSKETDRLLLDRLRASDDPCARAFVLLRLTGMRISELINLSADCIMTTARGEHFLKVPLGKMDNERLVPLCAEAMGTIHGLKSSQGLGLGPRDPKRLIGIKGEVHDVYRRLAARFKRFTTDIQDQGKPVTFHRLRHTYATSLMSGGVGIVSIMKLLGHRRIEMSLRYAQITPTHLRNEYFKALAAIERQFIPADEQSLKPPIARVAPAEIIDQLAAFIKKESSLPSADQKNLLRRLARLGVAIRQSHLPDSFPIIPTTNP